MFKWRNSLALILPGFAVWLAGILIAEERPYFEEINRVKVAPTFNVYPKVTPDGQYALASIYSNKGTINVYRLLPNGNGIDTDPVSVVDFDGLNNPLFEVSTIQLTGNGKNEPVRVYAYSLYVEHDMPSPKLKVLISGYVMSTNGVLSAIPGAAIVLAACDEKPFVVGRSLDIYEDVIFAITSNCIASMNIHQNGSLSLNDYQIILPPTVERDVVPRTLIYEPVTKQLFVGLQSYTNKPLVNNIFLLICAVNDDGSFNQSAPVYNMHFTDSYHNLTTILVNPQDHGEKIVSGTLSDNEAGLFASVFIIDPHSKQAVGSALQVRMQDIILATGRDRLYISSLIAKDAVTGVGLSAFKIQGNDTIKLIENSEFNSTLSHGHLELTPDGCRLIALAAGVNVLRPQYPSYLVLYQINDPELNCTAPSSTLPLKLIIALPTTVLSATGIALVSILGCYLIRKYGARKAYTPIN